MKTLKLIILFLILSFSLNAFAETKVFFTNKPNSILGWDYTTVEPDLSGFKLYYKVTGSTTAPNIVDIPGKDLRSYTWVNTPIGSYDLYLTAYDLYGNESDPSETIVHKKRIAKPGIVTKVTVTNPNFTMIIP